MEEPFPSQTEEETAGSLRAGEVGAPASLGSIAPTDQKRRKWQYVCRLLATSSLKEGAM
jgi:hypothetical protein